VLPHALPHDRRAGRWAARRVDGQIRKLPGFGGVQLLEAFAERALAA